MEGHLNSIRRMVLGEFAVNCWIYPLENGDCALIDPGAEGGAILTMLQRLHLRPRYILLTHGHFDHIAALPALRKAAVPGAIALHREDAPYLGPDAFRLHCRSFAAFGGSSFLEERWEDLPSPGRLLEEGERIGPFGILHLPGHTPGSIALFDEHEGILFSGDTLFNNGVGRTDLCGGDEKALAASLERLLSMDKNIAVYPGHGSNTSIGRESGRRHDGDYAM
ncbi:MAG: MBL fold metallo-hydrolase [Treponema sp.]|nr:MBL fold metallo-hydrolase [Treponema sp.]